MYEALFLMTSLQRSVSCSVCGARNKQKAVVLTKWYLMCFAVQCDLVGGFNKLSVIITEVQCA